MPFTKKTAKAAARKRWASLQLPDYGVTPGTPSVSGNDLKDLASEMPESLNALAAGVATWEDWVRNLSADAYQQMFTCPAIIKAIRKLSIRTAKMDWHVVEPAKDKTKPQTAQLAFEAAQAGMPAPAMEPEHEGSDRAKALTEIFSNIDGWSDFVENCTWALPEGLRIHQIKGVMKGLWKCPDFHGGGRRKYNAGGDMQWDGTRLVQILRAKGGQTRPSAKLPLDQFAIHRPGPGSNPEGDLNLGVALYNSVARPHSRAITAGDDFVRLFGVPFRMMAGKMDKVTPGRKETLLADMKAQAQQIGAGGVGAMSDDNTVKLLQADPKGLEGIIAWLRYLEGTADDILTLAVLTGGAGTSNANRTGDTMVQRDNEDEGAFFNACQIALTFNRYVLPWILDRNDVPPPDDPEKPDIYFWPGDPDAGNTQSASAEEEGPAKDEGKGTAPTDNKMPDDVALAAIKEQLRCLRQK